MVTYATLISPLKLLLVARGKVKLPPIIVWEMASSLAWPTTCPRRDRVWSINELIIWLGEANSSPPVEVTAWSFTGGGRPVTLSLLNKSKVLNQSCMPFSSAGPPEYGAPQEEQWAGVPDHPSLLCPSPQNIRNPSPGSPPNLQSPSMTQDSPSPLSEWHHRPRYFFTPGNPPIDKSSMNKNEEDGSADNSPPPAPRRVPVVTCSRMAHMV